MSCSVAISSFLRHEVSFWVCGSAILFTGEYRAYRLGAVAAAHSCVLPRIWVAYTEVCFSAYVETSRSCHTASQAWVGETEARGRFFCFFQAGTSGRV